MKSIIHPIVPYLLASAAAVGIIMYSAYADASNYNNCCNTVIGEKGDKGDTGATGANGSITTIQRTDTDDLNRHTAMTGALIMGFSPINHTGKHSHQSVGIGIATTGSHTGFALGYTGMSESNDRLSYKVGIAGSHTNSLVGAGIGWNF